MMMDILMGLVLVTSMETFYGKGWFVGVIDTLVMYHIFLKGWYTDLCSILL